jgi:hypothetical protein
MFEERGHGPSGMVVGQEKLAIRGHAIWKILEIVLTRERERTQFTRLPINWPNAHQMDKTTKRYWWDEGTNSVNRTMRQEGSDDPVRYLTQKHSRVDRKIATYSNRPDGSKCAQCDVIW